MTDIPFYSKRNQVYPALRQGRAVVEKHFNSLNDWQRERDLYAVLSGRIPLPAVLGVEPGLLVLEYKNHPTLLAELERQERDDFDNAPWKELAAWLKQCHGLCGQLPQDGNLRNFLWDGRAGQIIGLDLEGYGPDHPNRCGARLIAALLAYDPADTEIKRRAAGALAQLLSVPGNLVQEACRTLAACRQGRDAPRPMSGIVLAGGASRRMGQNKAELVLNGKTLLQHQVDKLRALGIEDIMLSGTRRPALSGTRAIPDEFPGKGPLAGLHACLKAARNPACLVLSVDVPLVPASALSHLRGAHREGVTVLCHGGREEPLIAVYDRTAAAPMREMLERGEYIVRKLKKSVLWNHFRYLGPEELILNCNCPKDFTAVKTIGSPYLRPYRQSLDSTALR